jgi:hypothetical protein
VQDREGARELGKRGTVTNPTLGDLMLAALMGSRADRGLKPIVKQIFSVVECWCYMEENEQMLEWGRW